MKKILLLPVLLFGLGCSVSGPFDRGEKTPVVEKEIEKPVEKDNGDIGEGDVDSPNPGNGNSPTPSPGEPEPPALEPDPILGAEEIYRMQVEPLVQADCMGCHPGKIQSYQDARDRITPGAPEQSVFYTKAIGQRHMRVWGQNSEAADAVIEWILAEAQ
ncbi:MAG: hypothetical protein R2827_06075 [Bdellovibrionales bacterium]